MTVNNHIFHFRPCRPCRHNGDLCEVKCWENLCDNGLGIIVENITGQMATIHLLSVCLVCMLSYMS